MTCSSVEMDRQGGSGWLSCAQLSDTRSQRNVSLLIQRTPAFLKGVASSPWLRLAYFHVACLPALCSGGGLPSPGHRIVTIVQSEFLYLFCKRDDADNLSYIARPVVVSILTHRGIY